MTFESELLIDIPQDLLPSEIYSAETINGGLNNQIILINDKFLVKKYLPCDEKNDPVFLRFSREKETLKLLKDEKYTPKLYKYYGNHSKLFIVQEWINGQTINSKNFIKYVNLIIEALSSLHKIKTSVNGDFDYFDVIRRYLKEYNIMKQDLSLGGFSQKIFSKLPSSIEVNRLFYDQLDQIQTKNTKNSHARIHGDLVFSNIILRNDKKKLYLIDWEYSTIGNPLIDIAYLISQNSIDLRSQKILVDRYEQSLNKTVNPNELELYCDLMNLMSAIWFGIHAYRIQLKIPSFLKSNQNTIYLVEQAIKRFSELNLV